MSAALPLEPDPFGSTTDPAAYLPRPACEAALAQLIGALRTGARKLALTGPTGMGKTQLLRVLAVRLRAEAETLILPYAGLEFDDLCQWALGLLGEPEGSIVPPGQALLLAARRREAEGRMLLLVLDDASSLPTQAARALAELVERGGGALRLLVVPVEDPRAGRVLAALGGALHEARLSEPMSLEETRCYVASRLSRCEVLPETLSRFDEAAVRWMHRESGGVPRLVHHLALLIQRGLVDRQDDRFARREQWLEIEPSAEPAPLDTEPVTPAAAADTRFPAEAEGSVGAAQGPGGAVWRGRPSWTRAGPAKAPHRPPLSPGPGPTTSHPDGSRSRRRRQLLAAAALLGLVVGAGLLLRSRSGPGDWSGAAAPPSYLSAATTAASPDRTPLDRTSAPTFPAGVKAPPATAPSVPLQSPARGPTPRALPLPSAGTRLAEGGARPLTRVGPPPPPPATVRPTGTPAAAAPAATPPASLDAELPPPPRSVAPAPEVLASPEPASVSGVAASQEAGTPEPAVPTVRVTIHASPWARVRIDGLPVGTTPLAGLDLRPGLHHFRLVFADGHTREAERVVDAQNRHFAFGLPSPRAPEPPSPVRSTGGGEGATSPPVGP